MRTFLTILLIAVSFHTAFSQYSIGEDGEPKIKRSYKLSDFSLHYSGAIFDFSSSYLNHMHELNNYSAPQWNNTDSTTKHNNRSEIYTRLTFSKQLVNQESSLYGNFSVGLCLGIGNRLDAAYISEYKSNYASAIINSNPVTNLDTIIILQNEYRHQSTEIGIDLAYTISSPPKPTLKGEFGVGLTAMYTVNGHISFTDSESIVISYLDQFSRQQTFRNLYSNTETLSAQPQLILKLYVPVILSYKLNNRGNFALSTMISGGVEFQKPKSGNFYSYPYFTIGIGFKHFF